MVASLVSSGVGASTTATISSWLPGNAFSKAISRWRQGRSVEISLLMSVLMAKFCEVYQTERPASATATSTTVLAWCVQAVTI